MIDINKDVVVNSTKELTKDLADEIVKSFLKYGTVKGVFTALDTDYDYKNVVKVDKEIDRVAALTRSVASEGGTMTSITSDLITVQPIIDYVLNGLTWTAYKDSFKLEDEI